MQNRKEPSFFLANNTAEPIGELLGLIKPSWSSCCTTLRSSWWSLGFILLGRAAVGGFALPSSVKGILWVNCGGGLSGPLRGSFSCKMSLFLSSSSFRKCSNSSGSGGVGVVPSISSSRSSHSSTLSASLAGGVVPAFAVLKSDSKFASLSSSISSGVSKQSMNSSTSSETINSSQVMCEQHVAVGCIEVLAVRVTLLFPPSPGHISSTVGLVFLKLNEASHLEKNGVPKMISYPCKCGKTRRVESPAHLPFHSPVLLLSARVVAGARP